MCVHDCVAISDRVSVLGGQLDRFLWVALCVLVAVVNLITCVLTTHLLVFHVKLSEPT